MSITLTGRLGLDELRSLLTELREQRVQLDGITYLRGTASLLVQDPPAAPDGPDVVELAAARHGLVRTDGPVQSRPCLRPPIPSS